MLGSNAALEPVHLPICHLEGFGATLWQMLQGTCRDYALRMVWGAAFLLFLRSDMALYA